MIVQIQDSNDQLRKLKFQPHESDFQLQESINGRQVSYLDIQASSVVIPEPVVQESEFGDLLALFQKLISYKDLDQFDRGHARFLVTWVVVWLMVYQRLRGGASLAVAVAELTTGATFHRLPDCKRTRDRNISSNTGAYSQARSALTMEAVQHVVDVISKSMIHLQERLWKNRHAYLIDGTTVTLEHRAELLKAFPPAINQHGDAYSPIVNVLVAHELGSGLAMRPYYGPMYGDNAVSETALARRILAELNEPSMLVLDRNFGILSMALAIVEAGHDVLVRLTDPRFKALQKLGKMVGPGEWIVEWRPSRWELKKYPELSKDSVLRGRIIEYSVVYKNETIVLKLFTNDMTATIKELVDLYGKRWSIEGDIKNLKVTMAMKGIKGRSVEMVEKEILMGIVAYNLVTEVRRMAAERANVEPRLLSFTRIMYLVQSFCGGMGTICSLQEAKERFDRLLKNAGQCRLPRKKKFRSYPREVLPRARGFPERKIHGVQK